MSDELEKLFEQQEQSLPEKDRLFKRAHRAQLAGELEQAAQLFMESIEKGRSDPGVHLDLARVLVELERFDQAVASLHTALKLEHDKLESRSILLAMSRAYEAQGDAAQAKEYYRRYQEALGKVDGSE